MTKSSIYAGQTGTHLERENPIVFTTSIEIKHFAGYHHEVYFLPPKGYNILTDT